MYNFSQFAFEGWSRQLCFIIQTWSHQAPKYDLHKLLQTKTKISTIDMILGTVKSESNKLTGKCPFLRWQKKAKIVTIPETISTVIFRSTP